MTILANAKPGVFHLGAIQTLGVLKDPRVTALLIDQLDDSSVQARRIATEALGEIADRGAIVPLLKMLNDQSAEVRWAAADALGSIGDASVADSLIAIIGKGRIWARRMVRAGPLDATGGNEKRSADRTYFLEHLDHPEPEYNGALPKLWERLPRQAASRNPASPGTETHPDCSGRARLLHPQAEYPNQNPCSSGSESVWHRGNGPDISKCRHPMLAKAAHIWARRQGMILLSSPEPGNIRWNNS